MYGDGNLRKRGLTAELSRAEQGPHFGAFEACLLFSWVRWERVFDLYIAKENGTTRFIFCAVPTIPLACPIYLIY